MTRFLLTLSVGPVQSLIEAGRRTRDLWCGSWLLSEVSKAVALKLHEYQSGCLIFPFVENPSSLQPQAKVQEDSANIANIIRAAISIDSDEQISVLVNKIKQAAIKRLVELSDSAKGTIVSLPIHEDLWQCQQREILEVYAAWVELKNSYPSSSKRLGELLAIRKATRDFAQTQNTRPGIPKSSLDGVYESVINVPHKKRTHHSYQKSLRQLGLSGGEELDVLGVTKRIAGNAEQFTPFSRIAANTWINSLEVESRDSLCRAYESLVQNELGTRVRGNNQIYADFPHDGALLFPSRLDNAINDWSTEELKLLHPLQKVLASIKDRPVPYGVLLKADGDKMGELLSKVQCESQSRDISKALHQFACQVRGIVQGFRGHAVYAGGDDVLAFVPLQNAIGCASELAQEFGIAMQSVTEQLGLEKKYTPTLSVGLAIGHVIQPIRRLRNRAIAAEKDAKGDGCDQARNALAIRLGIRSGPEISWRCRWDDEHSLDAMGYFVKEFEGKRCPAGIGYDLRSLDERLRTLVTGEEKRAICKAELNRLLDRARLPGNHDQGLGPRLKQKLHDHAIKNGILALANQLIIAKWLSARTESDLGVKG